MTARRLARRLLVTGPALVALAAVGGATTAEAARDPAKARVTLKKNAFKPKTVTVRKGGTVTWVWRDGNVAHDVVGPGFRSRVISSGKYKHRFKRRGTFRYVCTIHERMKGKVVVR